MTRRASTPLTEDQIAAMAGRIRELRTLVAVADRAASAASSSHAERWHKHKEVQTLVAEGVDIRDRLAAEFGRRFGWHHSKADFPLEKLRRKPLRWYDAKTYFTTNIDHPTFFREATRPCRPAAIAAHNYGPHPSQHKTPESYALDLRAYGLKLSDYAASFDCEATIITDFPSWYWPGSTTLVLYRPLLHALAEKLASRSNLVPHEA